MRTSRALEASLSVLAIYGGLCAAQNNNSSNIFYDITWAGPVQVAVSGPSANSTTAAGFDIAEATLVVPHLDIPQNPPQEVDEFTTVFWVGLDGFLTSDDVPGVRGLWQAGVIMSLFPGNGSTVYTGFYEWVPDDPVSLTAAQLAISAGDHIHVLVNTSDGGFRAGTTLTNLNTTQQFTYSQDAPVTWRGPTWPSPGTSAEWIMEAGTYLNSTRYTWPNWGNASILGARACYNTTGVCVVPGQAGTSENMTAVLWEDTNTLYSRSYVDGGDVWIAYVEEEFTG